MVKKSRTLLERYRRLKRIVRFLSRRGTLFRAKVTEKNIQTEKPPKKRKKTWRTWRKIRYLSRHGSLFRKKKKSVPVVHQLQSIPQNRKKKSGFSPYLTYRRLRFLYNTGRLFKSKKPEHPVKKRKKSTFRKIRFLLKRGTLFKFQTQSIKSSWRNYIKTTLKPDYLKIILNSTVLFLLAYFVVFCIINFISSISAYAYDIKSFIYYYKIDYLVNAKDWKADIIKVVFITGPFFSLILSLLVLVLYMNISQETWFIRLFLFWIFCHAFLHFFGEMFIGMILVKGLGLAIGYMFISEYKKILIILVSSSFLILAGFLIAKIALYTGNIYFNMITKSNRSYFLQSQFLIPSLLGFATLVLIKTPEITEFDLLVNLSMFLLILPIVLRGLTMKDLYFDPDKRNIRIRWRLLLIAGVVLFLFRVIFQAGIRIG